MSKRDKLVSDYIKELLSISKMCADHFVKDPVIAESINRTRERLILLKNENRDILITFSGPIIFRYKDMIKRRDLSEFTEEKLSSEISKLGKEDKSAVIFRYFGFAKKLYDEIGAAEREKLFSKLDSLLLNYVDYCIDSK